VLGLVALVVLATFGSALPASAHAGLVSADPAADTVLEAAPATVRLQFNEPVAPVATGFVLYDSSGRHTVDGTPSAVVVTGADGIVTAQLPPSLARGSYLLSWRVVSADAHPISGVLSFAVGEVSARPPAAPAGDAESLGNPVNSSYLLLQVLGYLGLFAAVGLAVFESLVLPAGVATARIRRRLLNASAAVAVVAFGLVVPLTALRESGAGLVELGRAEVWRTGAGTPAAAAFALVVAGIVLLDAGRLLPRWVRPLTIVGAVVAVASVLPTGHTRTYGPRWLINLADLVHASTAAVWFGGLLGLGLYLLGARRQRQDPVQMAAVVARFSGLAGALVALLGVSGLVLAVLIVGSVRAVFTTDYGHALVAKLALVAVVGLLAVWNKTSLVAAVRRRSPSEAQWRRLRGAVLDEILIVVVALAVTGLLTMLSPPVSEGGGNQPGLPAAAAPADSGPRRAELGNGAGSVQARLLPAAVGDNALEFTLRDADGAPMAAAAEPEVSATLPAAGLGPLRAKITKLDGVNRYRAEVPLPVSGDWRFTVSVPLEDYQPTSTLTIAVAG
jgi:copper transport protein